MNEDWKRKNAFIKDLRERIHEIRIHGVEIDQYVETAPKETTLGGMTGIPSDRGVVIIKLKGHWS